MTYPKLDNEELLRHSLEAIDNDRHADAVAMLKTLLERDAEHMFATYLLAAEHAQLGMMDRAEEGFRRAVALGPEFPMARFQLGQVCLSRGDAAAAMEALAPLAELPSGLALREYALGMMAAAQENIGEAIARIQAGLACPQEIPALAADMERVLGNLESQAGGATRAGASGSTAPLFLSNYAGPED
jgi:tetratricopeptide (TPR) repeat protein